jgi:hypothetical protein
MEYVSEVKRYNLCHSNSRIESIFTLNQRLHISGLILGPFNYPVLLVINALVGAIACNDDDDDDIGTVDCR